MSKRFIIGLSLAITTLVLVSCGREPLVSKDIESPFFGSKASKAQLVVYSDFQCPACINFHNKVGKKLETEYIKTGKIGYTFKNFPLPMHPNAPADAEAAMCAAAQGKFLEFADKMYALEEKKEGDVVTDEDRLAIAQDIGLDAPAFSTCVREGHYVKKVAADEKEAQQKNLPGTPSIFLNGTQIDLSGLKDEKQFFDMIDKAL